MHGPRLRSAIASIIVANRRISGWFANTARAEVLLSVDPYWRAVGSDRSPPSRGATILSSTDDDPELQRYSGFRDRYVREPSEPIRAGRECDGFPIAPARSGFRVRGDECTVAQQGLHASPLVSRRNSRPQVATRLAARRLPMPWLLEHGSSPAYTPAGPLSFGSNLSLHGLHALLQLFEHLHLRAELGRNRERHLDHFRHRLRDGRSRLLHHRSDNGPTTRGRRARRCRASPSPPRNRPCSITGHAR